LVVEASVNEGSLDIEGPTEPAAAVSDDSLDIEGPTEPAAAVSDGSSKKKSLSQAKPKWYVDRLARRRAKRTEEAAAAGRTVREYTGSAHVETQNHITAEANRVVEEIKNSSNLLMGELKKATGSSCNNASELRANIAVMQKTLSEKITVEKEAKAATKVAAKASEKTAPKKPKMSKEEKDKRDAERKAEKDKRDAERKLNAEKKAAEKEMKKKKREACMAKLAEAKAELKEMNKKRKASTIDEDAPAAAPTVDAEVTASAAAPTVDAEVTAPAVDAVAVNDGARFSFFGARVRG